jgi:pimeloyl-ACP methyl ester carboxylesterase
VVIAKVAAEHLHEPSLTPRNLQTITTRTLVLVADDDEVRLEHAVEMFRSLPDAELAVIPGTSHGLLVEKTEMCNQVIIRFLTEDPMPTLAPIRRRISPTP